MFSVIFDMDGTLTDTQKIFVPAWDYAGGNQGFKNAGKYVEYVCGVNDEYCTNFIIERFKGIDVQRFKKDVAEKAEVAKKIANKYRKKQNTQYLQ